MAKSENQKLRLFYVLQMLNECTDEEHALGTPEIITKLEALDIKAERKTIYNDIDCLKELGIDVLQKKSRTDGGYYLASRDFELAELKLLVDAVQASKFMTEKKSRELIKKLEKLVSRHQAGQLQRQVFVSGRVKTANERIYYNVDTIYKAIDENVKITFVYLEWNEKKELVPRKGGENYEVSPWALIWEDENYYLAAYDTDAGIIKHYRVDKMGHVELTAKAREGRGEFEKRNPAEYTKQTFGMYGGEEEIVTLRIDKSLIGVIIDRFGKETDIRKHADGTITARIKVAVSRQFFGWLAGLGSGAGIASPEEVKSKYTDWLQQIIDNQK